MKIIECAQGSEAWFEAHRGIPSASNFDKIITPKTMKLSAQADDLICELIAQKATRGSIMPQSYISPAMQNGITMEPEARRWLEFAKNLDVRQVGFITTDDGRFGCSPDGLIGEDSGLELKCPTLKTQVKYLWDGKLPDEYKAQVHGCMIVTGRPSWVFVSYAVGLDPLMLTVVRDEYTAALEAAMEVFWAKYAEVLSKIRIQEES